MSLCPSCGSALDLQEVLQSKNMAKELETLKQDMITMQRDFYRMTHNRTFTDVRASPDLPKKLTAAEVDLEMQQEEGSYGNFEASWLRSEN